MPPESRRLTALERAFLGAAAIAFLLLATYRLGSPGLYADELIFGPAALHALGRWRGSGRPYLLAIALALALVGLYDKLTFLWIIVAFGAALLLCWPRTVVAHLRLRPGANALLIGGFVVVIAAACWVLVLPAMQSDLRAMPIRLEFASQALNLVQIYNDTFSSNFVRTWMTSAAPEIPSWPFRMLVGQFVFMGVLAVRRPRGDPRLARA